MVQVTSMARPAQTELKASSPLSPVWIQCYYSSIALGIGQALKEVGHDVHYISQRKDTTAAEQQQSPSSVIYFPEDNGENIAQKVEHLQQIAPDAPILVLALACDLPLARAAVRAGARGFVHIGMQPSQIVRALFLASEGELVLPRELLNDLIEEESCSALLDLSPRQREILELVAEGLTNAQVAKRLFLSESTIKQHLRAAYKLLGVRNRTEATRLIKKNA